MDRKLLDVELSRLVDETAGLDLEKSLVGVFVHTQIGEMGVEVNGLRRAKVEAKKRLAALQRVIEQVKSEGEVEIGVLKKVEVLMGDVEGEREVSSRAIREMGEMKYELGKHVEKANGLREKVLEMEERERKIAGELGKLKMEREGMIEEKKVRESTIDLLMRDKDIVERGLAKSSRVIEDLKREIGQNLREKKEIEKERSGQALKKNELEKEVSELNGSVLILRDEKERLLGRVFELEKQNAKAVERREQMLMKFDVLQKEKKEKERSIHRHGRTAPCPTTSNRAVGRSSPLRQQGDARRRLPVSDNLEPCRWEILLASDSGDDEQRERPLREGRNEIS